MQERQSQLNYLRGACLTSQHNHLQEGMGRWILARLQLRHSTICISLPLCQQVVGALSNIRILASRLGDKRLQLQRNPLWHVVEQRCNACILHFLRPERPPNSTHIVCFTLPTTINMSRCDEGVVRTLFDEHGGDTLTAKDILDVMDSYTAKCLSLIHI